ncbi:hypothetical protein MnTg02_01014 [bacterium MnTg02]|nr:hypothetical protein MnTg02_01014 [bacterium MnTg02]
MRLFVPLTAFLLTALMLTPLHAEPRAGVASIVHNEVTGQLGGRPRVIRLGDGVFQNELIATGAESSTQLLFRDETSLTVGPKSEVRLDRFVYNPARKSGRVVIDIAKGAFRFVSGAAKPSTYQIRTPVATIGVRGTIFEGYFDGLELILVLIKGAIDSCIVSSDGAPTGVCQSLTKAGQYTRVTKARKFTPPMSWPGPTLDIMEGANFAFDENNRIRSFGHLTDPLPRTGDENDALDSRDLDLRFPPDGKPPIDRDKLDSIDIKSSVEKSEVNIAPIQQQAVKAE